MAFEFKGTPSFIVGKFRVPGVLTMAQFEQVIADARKAKAEQLASAAARKGALVGDEGALIRVAH